MRFDRTLALRLLWAVYAVMWIGGVLRLRDGGWAAPLFLFVAGAIALVSDLSQWKPLLGAAAIGFAFEVIGVRFGVPFGSYFYTGALAPQIFGVPVAIACAWMVIFAFARQLTRNPWAAAVAMTATDLLIDPVASGVLGYWRWRTPGVYFGVPLSNYAGWLLVSTLLCWLFRKCLPGPWSTPSSGFNVEEPDPGVRRGRGRPPHFRSLSVLYLGTSILVFFASRWIF